MSSARILNFVGNDAIAVARASNRSPEVKEEGGERWTIGSLWKLSAVASREPDRVRLRATPRVLAEAIVGTSIPRRRMPLADQLRELVPTLESPVQRDAMEMIIDRMTG